jgi:DNA-binding MarR family transcriptional regulator
MGVRAVDSLVENLFRLWREIRRAGKTVARQRDLTIQQFLILRLLDRHGPLPMGELARRVGVTPGSMTTACKRLERMGLVERRRGDGDGRVVVVTVTAEAAATLAAWRERQREALRGLLATLSEAEQAELGRLVEKLLAAREGVTGA